MEHERVGIGTELGDNEGNALNHQAGDEGDIAREAVELGHDDRAFRQASRGEGRSQLRPTIESVRALAGLDLGKLVQDYYTLGFGEAGDCGSLGFDA